MRLSWLCKWRSNVKSLFVLYISNHWAYRSQILYAYEYQGSSLIFLHPLMAYHLTCQHVKFSSSLFILLSFFHILCTALFYVFIIQSTWNFSWSFSMSWSCFVYHCFWNHSCMTSCRRHFVIFRFSHVIGYIFQTKYDFWTKFHRHKLQIKI